MTERGAARMVGASFGVSVAGSALFATTFALGGQPQLEGTGLAVACFGLMSAVLLWVKKLIPAEEVIDQRFPEQSPIAARAEAERELRVGLHEIVSRHRWLTRSGFAALGALIVAALFPVRSLGLSPEGRVGLTDWKRGLRLVGEDGAPVRAQDVPVGATVTAFPEGRVGPDRIADMTQDAVMLLHVDADALQLPPDRAGWAPQGFIAYSKVCTHAGCPVALYRRGPQQLMCPCHQSTFDVVRGGAVVFGPAARSLPQLPLLLDADGGVRAAGEMSGVIGPDTWEFP